MGLENQKSGELVCRSKTRTPGAPRLLVLAEEEIELKRLLKQAESVGDSKTINQCRADLQENDRAHNQVIFGRC